MYVLDTDVAIWILRGNEMVIKKLDVWVGKGEVAISTITIAELYKGILPSETLDTEEFIGQQVVLPVTEEVARAGGLYWQEFRPRLAKLSLSDCLVAATARVHDLTLLTLNVKHFLMKDIKVMNPLE